MPRQIKLCGLRRPADIDAAIASHADYAGLVFFPPSPRHISSGEAAALAARSGEQIVRVGVFVDADDARLREAVASGALGAVQLHGKESPARVAEVRCAFGLPVWKAISVRGPGDIAAAAAYDGAADLILFDAKTPDGAALPGGMGVRFDWGLMAGWRGHGAWGLSGGLDADNVAEAIAIARAPLIDVSSGIESAVGVKDVDAIRAFCRAVRAASPAQ